MDDVEARVRCLELATTVSRALSDHSPESIAEIATRFYAFVQTPPSAEKPVEVDKPKRGKPKMADLLD